MIRDWIYRWKRARALKHLCNAWYYMFKKNHRGDVWTDGGFAAINPIDQGDAWAEDILQERFWEMYTGRQWIS